MNDKANGLNKHSRTQSSKKRIERNHKENFEIVLFTHFRIYILF